MEHNIIPMEHNIIPMLIIGIISGLLTTMNIWIDKLDDIRFSINDLYMSSLMTGWMFLLYGIYHKISNNIVLGFILVASSFLAIRNQLFVDKYAFVGGMIPHHSMAIFMSKKLKETNDDIDLNNFLNGIITTQENEIKLMKSMNFVY